MGLFPTPFGLIRWLGILALWGVVGNGSLHAADAGDIETINAPACSSLLVSGNSEYPPLLWRDRQDPNTLTGVVPALLEEILSELSVDVSVRHMGSWARVQQLARDGYLDMVAGAFMTEERLGYMDYIMPAIIQLPTAVWLASNRVFPYEGWGDLAGKRGSTLINNSFGQAFDDYARDHLVIEGVRSIEQSFLMLQAGRVDYVLYELLQGQVKLGVRGMQASFTPQDNYISSENLYFTFPKKSQCNSPAFRQAFTTVMERKVREGRVAALVEEYTDKYISGG
ncbi:MAG: transporter substrate-binding domain-containing protein [Marinobacter sp.]|nr:transporter substrate-binding domain-containing protein [Marinobacter sp.]